MFHWHKLGSDFPFPQNHLEFYKAIFLGNSIPNKNEIINKIKQTETNILKNDLCLKFKSSSFNSDAFNQTSEEAVFIL